MVKPGLEVHSVSRRNIIHISNNRELEVIIFVRSLIAEYFRDLAIGAGYLLGCFKIFMVMVWQFKNEKQYLMIPVLVIRVHQNCC